MKGNVWLLSKTRTSEGMLSLFKRNISVMRNLRTKSLFNPFMPGLISNILSGPMVPLKINWKSIKFTEYLREKSSSVFQARPQYTQITALYLYLLMNKAEYP